MTRYLATACLAVLLLAAGAAAAQSQPPPKIPLADFPTPAEVMADFADDPPAVAAAKRAAILEALRKDLTRQMYAAEMARGDPAVRQLVDGYRDAESAIETEYAGNAEFDREWRRHTYGFYKDADGKERGQMSPAEFRLEFYERHVPRYAAWLSQQAGARSSRIFGARISRLLENIAPVSAVLIPLIFVLAALGFPRGIARLSADGLTMSFGGTAYKVESLTGKLLDTQARTATAEESGAASTVFIQEDDGTEHALEPPELDLSALPGHRLTFQTVARGNGYWFVHVYNHTTRKSFLQQDAVKWLLNPSWFWWLLTVLAWIGAWGLLSLLPSTGGLDFGGTIFFILAALTWIEFFRRMVRNLRFRRFRNGSACRELIQLAEKQAEGTAGGLI